MEMTRPSITEQISDFELCICDWGDELTGRGPDIQQFSEFLIQLCKKRRLFSGSIRNITFFGVRAEILLSRVIAILLLVQGLF